MIIFLAIIYVGIMHTLVSCCHEIIQATTTNARKFVVLCLQVGSLKNLLDDTFVGFHEILHINLYLSIYLSISIYIHSRLLCLYEHA